MKIKKMGLKVGLAAFFTFSAFIAKDKINAPVFAPVNEGLAYEARMEESFLVVDNSIRITTDRLNVRTGPSTNDKILGILDAGTTVKGEESGAWFKIQYQGQTAYVHGDWLRSESSENSSSSSVSSNQGKYVTTAHLNVRSGPGTNNSILGVLSPGTEITGTPNGDWMTIDYKGQTAYVHTDWLRKAGESVESSFTGQEANYYTTASLNIRTGPGTQYNILGVFSPNTNIKGVLNNGWLKTSYNGSTAYVSASYIKEGSASQSSNSNQSEGPRETKRTTAYLNVRTGPGTNYSIVAVFEPGTVIEGNGVGNWFKTTYDGSTVYVSQDYLTTNSGSSSNSTQSNSNQSNSAVVDAIVKDARAQVGKSYVYGAAGPNEFDCSGLTYYLYKKHAGITLPRSSASQSGSGTTVSKSNMKAGDLIFFINPGQSRVGHVAIYVGNGQYVHASTPSSGVCIDSTSGSYFKNNAVSIKRILN